MEESYNLEEECVLKNIEKPLNITGILTCRWFELPKRYVRNPGEIHKEYEIIYVDSGEFIDLSLGEPRRLYEGDFLVIESDVWHSTVCDGIHSANIFVTTFASDSPIMQSFKGVNIYHSDKRQRATVSKALSYGSKLFDINSKSCSFRPDVTDEEKQIYVNYVEILVLQLIQNAKEKISDASVFLSDQNTDSSLVNSICDFIKENIYNEINLSDICRKTGYSKCYIAREFKKVTGYTVTEYRQNMKINEAKRLINETNMSFEEIAEKLSFSSPQYFSTVFRRYTGMTPVYFKKKIFKGSLNNPYVTFSKSDVKGINN